MKNANKGVTLYVVDSNSYRFVNVDLATSANPLDVAQAPGLLRDLPTGVVFDAAPLPGAAVDGVRFSRLGGACPQSVGNCGIQAVICPEARCNDNTTTAFQMRYDPGANKTAIRLVDQRGGLSRTLEIAPGGRVVAN